MTARINQFLAFARPSEPKLEPFDPAAVARELAVLLDPDLSAKQVRLSHLASGTTIVADREMFRQALFNLLQNAVQASPEGETVEVTITRRAGGTSKIEVADRGAGVAGEVVDKLFTPYFTTRTGGHRPGAGDCPSDRLPHTAGRLATLFAPEGGAIFWLDGIHG